VILFFKIKISIYSVCLMLLLLLLLLAAAAAISPQQQQLRASSNLAFIIWPRGRVYLQRT
jgi:hypothetical protein